ncbi:MAG: ABC transporter ATP-binding protein [Anaerolineae bacterium]|jgi:peptide/nickel transport system ATP-binding protein|nr:ABC transporter ATP-binding protein [Anaerolineae bacterium]
MMEKNVLLSVQNLAIHFFTDEGVVKAVDGVDMEIRRGRTLCLVGESGCGKSVACRAFLNIIRSPGKIVSGDILLRCENGHGEEIVNIGKMNPKGKEIQAIRGKEISMIFQEPMTSLSMMHTVGDQIVEAILLHNDISKEAARERAIELLGKVGLPKPSRLVDEYPFRLSGGMRQRAMIAMALSCNPSLLIADEPTTALDVTTQAQIIELIRELQRELNMAVLYITHDLGVVAEVADDVAVMYLGKIVEFSDVKTIFTNPKHPYTRALMNSIPKIGTRRGELDPIKGMVPSPFRRPTGCQFNPRCPSVMDRCRVIDPGVTELADNHTVRCLLYEEEA